MWYELLKHLKNNISENFNGNVYIGADIVTQVNYDEGDVIVLSRGFEERGERAEERELVSTVYLETWIRDDSQEFQGGYEKLAELESKVERILSDFRKDIGSLDRDRSVFDSSWQILDISVKEKRASDESLRPLYGTLYVLDIRLYNLDETGGIW